MMYQPVARLLTIVHLLHLHDSLNAQDLAERLEVEPRTIRRYIQTLRDLGLPIEAEMGADGGYYLPRPAKNPPSIFSRAELELMRDLLLPHTTPDHIALLAKLNRLLDATR